MRFPLALIALAATLAAALASGCGTDPSTRETRPGQITIEVAPSGAQVATSGLLELTATVLNDPAGAGVNWTVAGGGTLSAASSASGVPVSYRAAASPASVTITATSVTDPLKSATATVTVVVSFPPLPDHLQAPPLVLEGV